MNNTTTENNNDKIQGLYALKISIIIQLLFAVIVLITVVPLLKQTFNKTANLEKINNFCEKKYNLLNLDYKEFTHNKNYKAYEKCYWTKVKEYEKNKKEK